MYQMIDIEKIEESKTNPRTYYDPLAMNELSESIKTRGVLQPVRLRALNGKKTGSYELIFGSRRLRGAKAAGLSQVPAIVGELSDEEMLQVQLTENIQRADMSPMEEAVAYQDMAKSGMSPSLIATSIGMKESYVVKRLQLNNLDKTVQQALAHNAITLGHALLIARVDDKKEQAQILAKVVFEDKDSVCRISTLDKYLRDRHIDMSKAIFDLSDKLLVKAAGACTECPHRSRNSPALFDEYGGIGDVCTKGACFGEKMLAHVAKDTVNSWLPTSQYAKVLDRDGDTKYNSGFHLGKDSCYDAPGHMTYAQVAKQGDVKPVYAISPATHEKIALYKDSEIAVAVRKLVKEKTGTRSGSMQSAKINKAVKAHKLETISKNKARTKVLDAVMIKPDDKKVGEDKIADLKLETVAKEIATILFLGCGSDDRKQILKWFYPGEKLDWNFVEKFQKKLLADEDRHTSFWKRLIIGTCIVAGGGNYAAKDRERAMKAIVSAAGLDYDKLVSESRKELQQKKAKKVEAKKTAVATKKSVAKKAKK